MHHQFDIEIAQEYGLNAAVILENLNFWIAKNAANEVNFHDGRYWTYNSVKAFEALFPYMTSGTIKRTLRKLEEDGLIVTGNYNKSSYDRTKWYALTEKGNALFKNEHSICQKRPMEESESANGKAQNGQPIPDNKPDTKPVNKPVIRHKHGEYSNVLLTDQDLEKLKAEFPEDWRERIERLSCYMASTGKSYKNHLATIRNWARMDKTRRKVEQKPTYKPSDETEWDF